MTVGLDAALMGPIEAAAIGATVGSSNRRISNRQVRGRCCMALIDSRGYGDRLERSFHPFAERHEGLKCPRPEGEGMSARGPLDEASAREIEEQLTTTHRTQVSRRIPVPLPRPDFWNAVSDLLRSIDLQLHEAVRKHGFDLRVQNLQRRQATIRRVASELARRRLVAMIQHASSQSLRTPSSIAQPTELASLDWSRHDPAEREFYTAMMQQMDRFKLAVDWAAMQNGLPAEVANAKGSTAMPVAPAGTTQLDAWSESPGGLTGREPPTLAFMDAAPGPELPDLDEEEMLLADRIDAWDEEQYLIEQSAPASPVVAPAGRHAAALELAPSNTAAPPALNATTDDAAVEPAPSSEASTVHLARVRVVASMEDAIVGPDGEALWLAAGDVHMLDADVASILIESGIAEAADL